MAEWPSAAVEEQTARAAVVVDATHDATPPRLDAAVHELVDLRRAIGSLAAAASTADDTRAAYERCLSLVDRFAEALGRRGSDARRPRHSFSPPPAVPDGLAPGRRQTRLLSLPGTSALPLRSSIAAETLQKAHGHFVPDCGDTALRRAAAAPQLEAQLTSEMSLAAHHVLDAVRALLAADSVTVFVPLRDGSKEFRRLCFSSDCDDRVTVRRLDPVEVLAFEMGYITVDRKPERAAQHTAMATAFVQRAAFPGGALGGARGGEERRAASVMSAPLRTSATSAPRGVVTVRGRRRVDQVGFSSTDEHHLFTVSRLLAHLLSPGMDAALFQRMFDARSDLGGASAVGGGVPPEGGGGDPTAAVHHADSVLPYDGHQLVYRLTDQRPEPAVKLLAPGGEVEYLSARTPLSTLSSYISQLQQSWKSAVLGNIALTDAYHEKVAQVGALLERARQSELRCTVLEAARVRSIPEDEPHHELYFRRREAYSCCRCGEAALVQPRRSPTEPRSPPVTEEVPLATSRSSCAAAASHSAQGPVVKSGVFSANAAARSEVLGHPGSTPR